MATGKSRGSGREAGIAVSRTQPVAAGQSGTAGPAMLGLLNIKPAKGGKSPNTAYRLIELVRAGVTRRAYDTMMEATGLTAAELADIMHMSDRTVRRYAPDQAFPQEQSERMVALAGLYSRGADVFGSMERFRDWMGRPQLAFGNVAPKSYLDTAIGIGLIMDELGRIEHGIFA